MPAYERTHDMLNEPQISKLIKKLERFSKQLEPHIFEKIAELDDTEYFHAGVTQHHKVPENVEWKKAEKGMTWTGESTYCWFKSDFTVPEEYDGKTLFVKPHIGGYEALLWVDGMPFGTFATKIVYTSHGNHYCDMIKANAKAGDKIEIALEYYAGHLYPGCHPNETFPITDFTFPYNGIDICIKNYTVQDFYFDLCSVIEIAKELSKDSFRRGDAVNTLLEVFKICDMSVDVSDWDDIMETITEASPILKEFLSKKNGDSAPEAAIIGHSHMDTAWLWHVGETQKKCCRTYANQLNLMEQYPEYKFVQSSACHSNFILKNYPELFKRIQKAVAEGKYEPNGGVWVECDCNITSGESMIRQFLWGQRFTRKYFNFTSNCFWLPDTFGYSAAIPQIMKGCSVDYFLTTKLSWNDTNKFPYDTFYWQGIDGTKVLTHFNTSHHFPDPKDIIRRIENKDGIMQKSVTNKRLLSFGFGDGGGGPQYEMLEFARRCEDTAGVPKTHYSLVGDFMKELEKDAKNPNTYRGELYLELHRGTLTNQHNIKRNNRKSELALRDLEIAVVSDAVKKGEIAASDRTAPLYETLLINQFHDILPGTCIARAHTESKAQTSALIKSARQQTKELLSTESDDTISFTNTLSFDRHDCIFAPYKEGFIIDGGYRQQVYTALDGEKKLLIAGVTIPAFSTVTLKYVKGEINAKNDAFKADGNALTTPFASVKFADNGTISSFVDTRANRELVNEKPFNTFMIAEDIPCSWDNWDVDADIEYKFKDCSNLVSREVISAGDVAYIIRSEYKLSKKSTLKQDMIFFADSAEVRFDTAMDWNDDWRFLKTFFDTGVYDDFARHDIQFGCAKRPTTRNNSLEQAKFEVVNHKYTDLSETSFGVSILNDCKYGISTNGGTLALSLHKGGHHPDVNGDKDGIHVCTYSFLPHMGSFNSESVIRPAYELNVPVVETKGTCSLEKLASVSAPNIFVEAVKPCEDAEKAYIVRLYEAEGTYTNATVSFAENAKHAQITNMLEEVQSDLPDGDTYALTFRPFEIKTIKVTY